MAPGLIIFLLVGALALLGWVYVTVRQRSTLDSPNATDTLPQRVMRLAGKGDALLIASEHGRLLHLNETAADWLDLQSGDLNLELLAQRASPSDSFLELFAGENRSSFQIAGRWVEATSHRIPAGSDARTVVVMRAITRETQDDQRYDLSRALNIINAIGETLDASLSIEQVLQALLTITIREVPADAGEICLYDPETDMLMPRGWVGNTSYVIALAEAGGGYHIGEGISGYIAAHRKPALVTDRLDPTALRPLLSDSPYRSYAGVPLMQGERLIGTFELASEKPNSFQQSDIALLSALANAYVTTIHNTQLYTEQTRRMEDLASLPTAALRAGTDAASVYQMLVERIARLMDVQIAGVLLHDDKAAALVAQEPFIGLPSQIVRSYRIPLPPDSEQRYIFESASSWSSADLADEPLAVAMKLDILTNAAGVRDILLVPMLIGSRRIGMMQVSNRNAPGGFTRRDEQNLRLLAAQAAVIVEELRLYEQDVLRESELMSLQEITQAFGALSHSGDVYVSTNAQVARLMGVEKCGVLLYEEAESRLVAQLPVFGMDDEYARHYQIPLEPNGYLWHMWRDQDFWLSNDLSVDPVAVGAGLADFAEVVGVTQTLIVPLSAGGRRFGVIQVSNKLSGEPFTEKDARLLAIFAAQVAAMIENTRLFREARRRADEADAMRRIAELCGKILTAEDPFAPALEEIVRLLGSPFGFMNVINQQTGELVTYPRNVYGNIDFPEPYIIDSFSPGFEHSVFMSRRPFLSNDVLGDKRILPAYADAAVRIGIRKAVIVPLAVGKTSLGELGVCNRESPYDENDLRLLETIAPQLAAALDRLRLYDATGQNLSRRIREMDAISRVTTELAQTLDMDTILDAIRIEAQRVTDASGATLALFETDETPDQGLSLQRRLGDLDIEAIADIEREAALRGTETVLVEDYAGSPELKALPEDSRSAVAVAILYEDRVVGVLHLYSEQPRKFDAQAGGFLMTMATKAAIGYGNALRYLQSTEHTNRLRRRAEQLNQIFELGQIFQHNTDRDTLLEAICYSIQQSVGFDIVLVAMLDEESGVFRQVAQAGMPIEAFVRSQGHSVALSVVESSLKPAYLTSESYFLPFEKFSDWNFPGLQTFSMSYDGKRTLHPRGKHDWRDGDMLLVPLRGIDGKMIGIISLDRPFDGKRPERATIEVLEIFAQQASSALENARIFDISTQTAEQQARLNEVLEAIARTLDVREIVYAVASGVQKLTPYERMTFALQDPEQNGFQVITITNGEGDTLNVQRERRADLARTALGRAYASKADMLYLSDDTINIEFDDLRAWRGLGERTSLIAPLITGGLVLGALHIGSNTSRERDYEAARPLLRRIANLAAVALQNGRLFNQAINLRLFNESVVDSIQQGIVVLDSSGLIMTVNDYMKREYGWSDNALRQDLFAYRPSLKPVLGDAVQTVLREGEPQELLRQNIIESGDAHIENLYLYPLLAADSVRGVVLLVEDLTERYSLERTLETRAQQLTALNEASSQLSASLERDAVLTTMFDAMQRIIAYDAMTLWRRDDDALVLEAARGADYLAADTRLLIADDPAIHALLESGHAHALSSADVALPGGMQGRSWLGVPMTRQGTISGILMLAKESPDFYDTQAEQAGLAFANQVAVSLQNATLFNETSTQMERLRLINRVSIQLAQSLDTENILEIALRELTSLLEGERGRAYVFERELSLARLVVDHPRGDEPPSAVLRVTENAALRHAFSSPAPLIISNIAELPHDHPLYAELVGRGVAHYVLIPLVVGGQTSGMFELEGYTGSRSLDAVKIDMAMLIANQSSIAVLNANLLEQTMVRTRELETLLEAAQATSFTLDLAEVLQSVVRLTVQALDMDDCLLMLYDNVEEELEVMVDFSRMGDRDTTIAPGTIYDLLRHLTKRQAMQNLQVTILRMDGDGGDPQEFADMQARGVITRILIPLKARDEGIGLLQVDSKQPHRFFSHREARMAQALGAQAAISIENARLSTETANQVSQSLVINDLSRAISSTMDLNVMIRIVREQVPLLTDAEAVYLALYDPKTQLISFPMAVHEGNEYTIPPRPLTNDEVSFVIKMRRPLPLGGDHPSIDEVRRNLGIVNGEDDAKRYLGVPLIAGDQVVGVLAVRDTVVSRPFGLNDQRILTTIGTQLGATIQNAQLFAEINERVRARTLELQQERDRLDALYRVTSQLVSTADLRAALGRALPIVADAIGAEEGVVLLYDAQLARLNPLLSLSAAEQTSHPADMLGEWIMRQAEPVIVEDLHRVPYWNERVTGAETWRSAVGAPLGGADDQKGVLIFLSARAGHFSEPQLRLVSAAAYQFAAALKDAELYSLIRSQNEQLTTLLQSEQEERGKSAAILQSIADGVVVVDSTGKIVLVNEAAERILETPRSSAEDQTLSRLAAMQASSGENWAARLMEWVRSARERSGSLYAGRIELGPKTIDVQLSPVMTGDQTLGTVAVFRDITRDMELERRKSEFIANVSHELRTPLTSIKGYTDLIAMGVGGQMNDQQVRFMSTIRENTERMTTLVNDLLQIAALDAGSEALNPEPLDIVRLIGEIVEEVRSDPEHAGKQIAIEQQIEAGLPPLEADKPKITQALTNVVDNAFSYTNADGRIDISARRIDSERLLLSIRDNGVGIPEEYHERVWNRFERVEQHALSLAVAGTGLGLPIAKQVIEMHGGRIWFESVMNEGTTFYIELPLRQITSQSSNGQHSVITEESAVES
jgi:GAF domain-containing protein/sensor histidine kinase regulating citrate/malate metabolism